MMDRAETTRTILVVADNALMRKLFIRCLEEGGFTVVEASDPVTPADRRRLAEAGFDGPVSKPIKPRDFQPVVASFLAAA